MRIGRFVVCFHGVADDDSQHEEACIISILASKAVSVVYEKFPMFGCVHFRTSRWNSPRFLASLICCMVATNLILLKFLFRHCILTAFRIWLLFPRALARIVDSDGLWFYNLHTWALPLCIGLQELQFDDVWCTSQFWFPKTTSCLVGLGFLHQIHRIWPSMGFWSP